MLLDPRTLSRPYLERKGVEAVVHGHLKGDRNYTTAIHRLLTLELLHRLFLAPGSFGGLIFGCDRGGRDRRLRLGRLLR